MKLGIIGAMEVEVETLLEQMENRTVLEKAGSVFYEGILAGIPAVVVRCGVGKVNAALCVQILCDCFAVSHIVNTGIAGSLNAELDIGDLVAGMPCTMTLTAALSAMQRAPCPACPSPSPRMKL